MAREYGERQPDGSVNVYREDDNGNITLVRNEPWEVNQGTAGSSAPAGGGNTYTTPNGPRTLEQIRSELQAAGYGGPWDAGSMLAAYNSTASGGGAAGTSGVNDILNNVGRSNQEDFQLTKDKFDWQKLSEAAQIALQALGIATDYASNPRDYFKFNQYTSQGRNIFEQLNSSVPRAAFSTPTGPIEPGQITDVLSALGISFGGGAAGEGDENAALDAIWQNRPDLANFYRSNGWSVDTPEQQRAAVKNWLQMTDDPDVVASGRDAGRYASSKGWVSGQTTQTQQTQQATDATRQSGTNVFPDRANVTPPTASNDPRLTNMAAALASGAGVTGGYTTSGSGAYWDTLGGSGSAPQTQPIGGSVTLSGNTYPIQLPHQVNPMVWDSLGPVGQQLALGAVGAAGWDPSEYVYQLNAARPKGTAPRSTRTYFQQPASLY